MKQNKKKMVKIEFTNEALGILSLIGKTSTDPLERRIIRMRRNLFLAVDSLNKELVRHPCKVKIRTMSIERLENGIEIHRPIPDFNGNL